jgi:hypothetical protein
MSSHSSDATPKWSPARPLDDRACVPVRSYRWLSPRIRSPSARWRSSTASSSFSSPAPDPAGLWQRLNPALERQKLPIAASAASGEPRSRTSRCGFGDRRVTDTPVPRGIGIVGLARCRSRAAHGRSGRHERWSAARRGPGRRAARTRRRGGSFLKPRRPRAEGIDESPEPCCLP